MNDITAHMIVKNEEQWAWYAVMSVIEHVDVLLIYDTGSTDKTANIITSIKSPKIQFFKKGRVNAQQLVNLRNEQISKTKTEWFILLDGDEVWPKKTIIEFMSALKKCHQNINGVVVPTIVPVGNLFHYQQEEAGKYELMGKKGHMNIRGYRKRTGYLWKGLYPLEAYSDESGKAIQENSKNLIMLENTYWHLTHLRRSVIDSHGKRKLEIGEKKDLEIPEVFFKTRPKNVPSPWVHFSEKERLQAVLVTPLLHFKRSFI